MKNVNTQRGSITPWLAAGIILLLGTSAICFAAAPLVLPESYSWVSNTTSEAAAQGVHGAWLAKFGFLSIGLSVLTLCALKEPSWGLSETLLLAAFGICMLGVATFAHRPWWADASYDKTEDALHSAAATIAGFAFTLGVLSLAVRGRNRSHAQRWVDLTAVATSLVLPFAMAMFPGLDGVIQRLMFAVAYTWFGLEAFSMAREPTATMTR
jgi:hypothetical protein